MQPVNDLGYIHGLNGPLLSKISKVPAKGKFLNWWLYLERKGQCLYKTYLVLHELVFCFVLFFYWLVAFKL